MDYNKKCKRNSGRNLPFVNFIDCNELELKFIDWLTDDRLINESVGLLILRLNILKEEENIIDFCDYNKDNNSFKCIINDRDIFNIRINNLDDKNKDKEIVVVDNDIEYTYKCESVNNIELGMRIILFSYKKEYLYGLVKLRHYLSRDYVIYDIDYMKYYLRLKVVRPDYINLSMFDTNGRYSRYILDNEEGLISYLVNLIPKFNVVDIFESICDISLGYDVSMYPEIYLEFSYGNEFNRYILDLICLRYGKLEKFGITNLDNNKSLFLNNDNSFEYREFDEGLVKFLMISEDDIFNYSVSISKDSDVNSLLDMIKKSIVDAKLMNEEVKVLSRKLINMNKSSS